MPSKVLSTLIIALALDLAACDQAPVVERIPLDPELPGTTELVQLQGRRPVSLVFLITGLNNTLPYDFYTEYVNAMVDEGLAVVQHHEDGLDVDDYAALVEKMKNLIPGVMALPQVRDAGHRTYGIVTHSSGAKAVTRYVTDRPDGNEGVVMLDPSDRVPESGTGSDFSLSSLSPHGHRIPMLLLDSALCRQSILNLQVLPSWCPPHGGRPYYDWFSGEKYWVQFDNQGHVDVMDPIVQATLVNTGLSAGVSSLAATENRQAQARYTRVFFATAGGRDCAGAAFLTSGDPGPGIPVTYVDAQNSPCDDRSR